MVPPVSAICGVAPASWASASRVSSSPAADGGERGGVLVDLDPRRRSSAGLPQLDQPARGGGVHVVLVEPAQLLGEQLGQLAALQRDRPVGLAGRGERRQLAVGREIAIGPSLVSSRPR